MEMHQVRYFLAVAEELNFTRAAERCNVAQPSLTRAIKLLEGELGGPLFNRERANTHLSELGRMVKPYLEQVYEQTREAKRQALDFVKLKKTVLKLGVMCTIAPDQLVDLVCAVQSRNPGIELEIIDSSAEKLEERLIEGELEVAIYCPAANQKDERLHYMPLYREQFLVVLPAEHPLAAKNGIRPGDLNGLRYLNRINCEFNGYAGALWKEHGLTCETAYRSERDDWILAMVASGLGSSCASAFGRHAGRLLPPLDHCADDEAEDEVAAKGCPGEGDEIEEGRRSDAPSRRGRRSTIRPRSPPLRSTTAATARSPARAGGRRRDSRAGRTRNRPPDGSARRRSDCRDRTPPVPVPPARAGRRRPAGKA